MGQPIHGRLQNRNHNVVLGAKVIVDRGLTYAELVGNHLQRSAVHPVLTKEPQGCARDLGGARFSSTHGDNLHGILWLMVTTYLPYLPIG